MSANVLPQLAYFQRVLSGDVERKCRTVSFSPRILYIVHFLMAFIVLRFNWVGYACSLSLQIERWST